VANQATAPEAAAIAGESLQFHRNSGVAGGFPDTVVQAQHGIQHPVAVQVAEYGYVAALLDGRLEDRDDVAPGFAGLHPDPLRRRALPAIHYRPDAIVDAPAGWRPSIDEIGGIGDRLGRDALSGCVPSNAAIDMEPDGRPIISQ
jgi:hypothetical protein